VRMVSSAALLRSACASLIRFTRNVFSRLIWRACQGEVATAEVFKAEPPMVIK